MSLLSECYTTYCSGIPSAMDLLTNLQSNTNLCRFQQTPRIPVGYPNLPEFINKPFDHIEELISLFEDLSSSLSRNNTTDSSTDLDEIVYQFRSCLSSRKSDDASADELEYGFVEEDTYASIDDRDVLERLSFMEVPTSSKISLGDCKLIHMSDVMFVDDWRWTKMVLILLNNILLLAEYLPDGSLSVKQEPISLSTVVDCDTQCYHRKYSFAISNKINVILLLGGTVDVQLIL